MTWQSRKDKISRKWGTATLLWWCHLQPKDAVMTNVWSRNVSSVVQSGEKNTGWHFWLTSGWSEGEELEASSICGKNVSASWHLAVCTETVWVSTAAQDLSSWTRCRWTGKCSSLNGPVGSRGSQGGGSADLSSAHSCLTDGQSWQLSCLHRSVTVGCRFCTLK